MIQYQKLDTGTPPDIRLITDDANAEMAAIEEMFVEIDWTDAKTFQNMGGSLRNSEGNFAFVIPGDEAGELAELIYAIDDGALDKFTDNLNEEAIKAAEDAM